MDVVSNEKQLNAELNEKGNRICRFCKKVFTSEMKEFPYHDDFQTLAVCEPCKIKLNEIADQDCWNYATSLIGTQEIHCIKCKTELMPKDISSLYTDEEKVSFQCPNQKCKLEFTIYHGEPDDPREYDEPDEEEMLKQHYISKYGEW